MKEIIFGDIEKRSFEIIEKEVSEKPFQGKEWLILRRMIHASADFELLSLVRFHKDAVSSGIEALKRGCFIFTDTRMALSGIRKEKLKRLGCKIRCFLGKKEVKKMASEKGLPRSYVAVDFSVPYINGGIYVIGNSPTALIRVVELVEKGICLPSLIIGMPVGFVNVSQAKEMLVNQNKVPYITVIGRKGGTALAVAAINQLIEFV